MTRPWVRACATALAAGGLGLTGLGLTTGVAQAVPAPAPTDRHHWCPGDRWDQGWGPPQPPPPWAQVVWNPNVNAWGFWNGPAIWIPL
ncbi:MULTISPECIES: hypothetical protein [unclassified Mycolicibacterium]|uniref:hypothetical protein n=1 Tax=unclassified Mycolicibacterium TaxID=2636767 RepID=UPI002EDA210A